jgi:hypothetical protein
MGSGAVNVIPLDLNFTDTPRVAAQSAHVAAAAPPAAQLTSTPTHHLILRPADICICAPRPISRVAYFLFIFPDPLHHNHFDLHRKTPSFADLIAMPLPIAPAFVSRREWVANTLACSCCGTAFGLLRRPHHW